MKRLVLLVLLGRATCGSAPSGPAPSVPRDARADYAVFAERCSKCHALSRALDSGIVEDAFWARYVDRMRRQPASGISPEDVPAILRFLHRHSAEQLRKKQAPSLDLDAGSPPAPPATSARSVGGP